MAVPLPPCGPNGLLYRGKWRPGGRRHGAGVPVL